MNTMTTTAAGAALAYAQQTGGTAHAGRAADYSAARDIIAEFVQCADAGRPPGKLIAQAKDYLATQPAAGMEPK